MFGEIKMFIGTDIRS